MNINRDDVFGQLEPPPGGLQQLRARLAHRQRRTLLWTGMLATPALVAALGLLVLARPPRHITFTAADNPALLRLSGASSAQPGLQVAPNAAAGMAVLKVASGEVDIYWMGGRMAAE